MPKQFPGLPEALLASGAFEQTLDAMDVLVVQQMGRLQEALVALIALERPVGWVFVCTPVADKRILLFETHLALFALKRPLF